MPSRYKVETVLADCERISRVWTDNPTFSLGEVTLVALKAKMAEIREKREQLETLRMQVAALSNDVDAGASELAAIRTRALSGLRATYGPNSTQYEQGGGTRQSERRKPTRKGGNGGGGSTK
jgi:outer membrane murein-binding lipoprotein Lpp